MVLDEVVGALEVGHITFGSTTVMVVEAIAPLHRGRLRATRREAVAMGRGGTVEQVVQGGGIALEILEIIPEIILEIILKAKILRTVILRTMGRGEMGRGRTGRGRMGRGQMVLGRLWRLAWRRGCGRDS
jgi:hypothetical protein